MESKVKEYRRLKPGDAMYSYVTTMKAIGQWWGCDSYDHNENDGCSNPICFKYNGGKHGVSVTRKHKKTCRHRTRRHLADNGSTSAGVIYWCATCGAISITSFRDEFEWRLPYYLKAAEKGKRHGV
jgi:hypothetical protein